MGYEFQVETRRILWLTGLVIASVLIIQYFELPYRNTMSFLFSSGKASFLGASGMTNGTLVSKGRNPDFINNSSSSMLDEESKFGEQFLSKNTTYSNSTKQEKARDLELRASAENATADVNSSSGISEEETNSSIPREIGRIAATPSSFDYRLAPSISPSDSFSFKNTDLNMIAPAISFSAPSPSAKEDAVDASHNEKTRDTLQGDHTPSENNSSVSNSPPPKEISKKAVVSISEMMDMLHQSRVSSFSKVSLWPSAADQELLDARSQIEHATIIGDHPSLYAPVYRNLSTFVRSYEIMEQKLKVYIYREGKRPVFHQPKLKGIYASEGWFMKLMESSQQYVTSNPKEAQLFYLPFSSQILVEAVYVPDSHSFDDIREYLKNYLDLIKTRYPFWNRTDGADHFLVACHDWAPADTRPRMTNCIRAMCNADVKEGFQFGKDVSLPETNVNSPQNPTKEFGRNPSERKFLAFFAGQMHGYVRPILLKHWENKDPDMKIFGRMKKANYIWHMKNSKYCICAKGYEVNSPRVVESIVYECIPVIISDNFVPPFFEILQWESFAVFVLEKDIPNLKSILLSISERRYKLMQKRVKMVRQHFLWHTTPVKYDIFHMILHSVWYNRVFRLPPK
ncbi:Exostosin family protein [Forsythia ovata]|uniref:Exostosin family protein n=1 Tax=Forsythia ovata TaxID=205694 RepID=A0ABD1W5K6_9LAMI